MKMTDWDAIDGFFKALGLEWKMVGTGKRTQNLASYKVQVNDIVLDVTVNKKGVRIEMGRGNN